MGSLTYAKYSRSRRGFVFDFVFANPFSEIVALLEAMRELGIKPEHECFDLGHVGALVPILDMGLLQAPLHADFVMGVLGGVPASARNLAAMAENLVEAWGASSRFGEEPAARHHWGVIGIGRAQWPMIAAAISLGGSVRVGLEDNFYLPSGALVEGAGRRAATVGEARALIGLPAPSR
jgi:uncharacterized protein (DUF849 family)